MFPGRLTPPPAVMAKFWAVRIAPFVAFTEPGVRSLRFDTFVELKVVFAATVISPLVAFPNWRVVALRNPALLAGSAKAEFEFDPRTIGRPEVRG